MRQLLVPVLVVAGLLAAAACGQKEPHTVPNVTGMSLDAAQARLGARDLESDVEGGGTFGIVIRSHWQVCDQVPGPGRQAVEVTLVVERACSTMPPHRSTVVPDVEYEALDEAQEELTRAGLGYEVEPEGEIVVRSNWTVCSQEPSPGEWGDIVELYVEHGDCWDW